MNEPPPILADLALAYRFLYYCKAVSLVSDASYDDIEKAALETVGPDHQLHKPGSDNPADYEAAIHALAIYLRLRLDSSIKSKNKTAPTPAQQDMFS